MLPAVRTGSTGTGPKIIMLHWLGGSSRSWTELAALLAERGFECIALDLPGFGDAQNVAGFDVAAMRDAVLATLREVVSGPNAGPWMLAGHSMGGMVATVVAKAVLSGTPGPENLRGIVLFSPSPPSPEPMKESKRQQMLKSPGEPAGNASGDQKNAKQFVEENVGKLALPSDVLERAAHDVLRMNRTAFRMWLEHGSKEDWAERVGVLPVEALVFAGGEEQPLGEEAQRTLTLPHFSSAELVILQGAGHLGPMERPREATEYISEFVMRLGLPLAGNSAHLDQSFADLIASERTSPQTRTVMEARLEKAKNWKYRSEVLSQDEFRTLRAIAARIVPGAGFDTAAIVESGLAEGSNDGWRFADLPPDAEAWQKGIRSLDAAAGRKWGVRFLALDDARMDELLQAGSIGDLGKGVLGTLHLGDGADAYSAAEMKQWLEDVRSEFAKCYMAHPGTMNRVGFTGFADEGGFTQIRLGEREEFEQ